MNHGNNRGIDATVEIDAHADPAAVFAYLKNPEKNSVWEIVEPVY